MKIQRKVVFWLRVADRPKWEALKAKGIRICDIISRGINLVYEEEQAKGTKTEFWWKGEEE